MQISIITNDPKLTAVCEKALEGLSPLTIELRRLGPAEQPDGDVCIWEFHADVFPKRLISAYVQRSLFIVDQSDLARFRECLGGLRASIALKPVFAPTLLPFLQHSFGVCQAPQQSATEPENVSTGRREANILELFMQSQAGSADTSVSLGETNE